MTFEGRHQMSTVTTTRCRHVAEAVSPPALPAELVDGITDAILASSSRAGRAEVIARLVGEMYESVAWLGADADVEELLSLRRLVDEAGRHSVRAVAADDLEAQDLNEKSRRAVEAGPLG